MTSQVAAGFDPRTVPIQPQDILYYMARIAGDDQTLSAAKIGNVAGLLEMAAKWNALAQVPAIVPSKISGDDWLRFKGYIPNTTDPRPSQATLLMTVQPSSSEQVSIDDGAATRAYSYDADGDVQVAIGATLAQSCRNLVNAIRADVEAGNADLEAVYLGENLFGTTGHLIVFWPTVPTEWADNDLITTDITDATVTGFVLGVAGS